MYRTKTIDFDKIQNMLDAARSMDLAEENDKAEAILKDMASFIMGNLNHEAA